MLNKKSPITYSKIIRDNITKQEYTYIYSYVAIILPTESNSDSFQGRSPDFGIFLKALPSQDVNLSGFLELKSSITVAGAVAASHCFPF